jgi:hypothetical protein
MNIDIFTEGSSTFQEDPDDNTIAQYFGGGFLSVKSLADKLSEYGETNTYVISKEFGFVKGDDEVPEHSDSELEMEKFVEAKRAFRNKMVESASSADVIIILLTKDTFRTNVASNWKPLVDAAEPDSIWCIATSGKAFDKVDIDILRKKGVETILYERVGVARIGNETREELIKQISG